MPASESPRRRILVVDDEQDIIDILQEHLATTYDVTSARDGRRALELVRATHPDLIFLDIAMPGINGMDVLKAMKQLDPTIPVIAISAAARITSRGRGRSAAAQRQGERPQSQHYRGPVVARRPRCGRRIGHRLPERGHEYRRQGFGDDEPDAMLADVTNLGLPDEPCFAVRDVNLDSAALSVTNRGRGKSVLTQSESQSVQAGVHRLGSDRFTAADHQP